MERLTEKTVGCFEYALKDHKAVPGEFCTYDAFFDYSMAVKRLGHYEDTGLEPEEIKVHEAAKYNAGYYHGDEDRCRWIEKELGPIDHLRDLLQAEQDGRLVVLPCGTDVYLERDGYVFKADHWNHTLTAFRDEPKNKSGKQIALFSTKEAEAALKGGEG